MLTPLRPWRRAAALSVLLATIAAPALAQTPFVPYFGKNEVRYDSFKWQIYTTDHFEIYYYPETEQHLERIAGYAESAYQKLSSELKHDLAFRIPLLIFKTQAEFQQQNVIPGAVSEGVAAFAEPVRNRMLVPIDEPPDQLYRLITHELTHIFEFDIIPRSLVRRTVPLWVDEGLADYMAGVWRPLDLMTVRDATVADIIPRMTEFEGYGQFTNPRLVYNLGHAAFEFIESRWGKEGIRQYLFSLRKSVIGGGEAAYEEALRITADEFDQQFERYMKDRFKPFRDKERPADYGRDLAPERGETKFTALLSIEPSPSGELLAAVAGNRKEGELDVILLSTKDRSVVRNLTPGFSKDTGFEYIGVPGARWNTVPWLAWSPTGDRIAYFVRTEKQRSLLLQNVVTGRIERRYYLNTVDVPESPEFSQDGRKIYFSALRNAVGDIFELDLESGEVRNLTSDAFADYAPTISPDGTFLVYLARVSGNDKLFRLDLATGDKRQLTFGTHDEAAAQFLDAGTLVFPSTAVDPAAPVDADVIRDGQIYNLWTLDLKGGALRQYTDTLTSNVSPVVLADPAADDGARVAFVTYFKGEYGIHTLQFKEPIATAASADFGEPAPVIDFQAPLTHTIIPANNRVKGRFEKMFLDGRPPINVGVTSGGDLFGGTAISFSDVLGDQNFTFFAASVSQFRTFAGSYTNLSKRLQYSIQAYSQTQFYYGLVPGFYDPALTYFLDRDDALATRSINGASIFAIYPFNRYTRLELSGGVSHYSDEFRNQELQDYSDLYQQATYGATLFNQGLAVPLTVALTRETTVFREYGPLAGHTFRMAYSVSPKLGDSLSRQTFDGDFRYYQRIGTNGVAAFRFRGFNSSGSTPDYFFYGGNSELRGYDYLQFVGNKGFFANAELRFPLIEAMLTPIGVLGGIRGVAFAGIGGASLLGRPTTTGFSTGAATESYKFATSEATTVQPIVGFSQDPNTGFPIAVYGDPVVIDGFRLQDGRASYGIGLETFLLGFPIHFDWSWRTLFNKDWENIAFAFLGGSSEFRKARFQVWIGYDF